MGQLSISHPVGRKSYRALLGRSWVLSHVWIFVTLWAVAHQAPLSMGFPRQEHWSELPFPPPGDLPDQGLNLCLLCWQADSLLLWHQVMLTPKGSWRCPRSGLSYQEPPKESEFRDGVEKWADKSLISHLSGHSWLPPSTPKAPWLHPQSQTPAKPDPILMKVRG